jgi:4-hydroxy-3-polyprenylbenzoate decarboxylase
MRQPSSGTSSTCSRPEGIREKVKGLLKLKSVADSRPKVVSRGACQELFFEGADVDLTKLPVQRCWPGDPAPFITLPAVITQDPKHGYAQRRDVSDAGHRPLVDVHALADAQGRPGGSPRRRGRSDPAVAVAIGLRPVTAYSASAPLPKHLDELMLAGFLRGEPVELVALQDDPLEVPANAEIVLEGWVAKDDVGIEGRSATTPATTRMPSRFPIFRISALTMRRDAIYASIVVGKPPGRGTPGSARRPSGSSSRPCA